MTHSFYRSYGFLAAMLACIVLGCAVGAAWPGAVCLEPLGTVFINMMFASSCRWCSARSRAASPIRARGAGRGASSARPLGVFVVTGLLAAFIMLVIVRVFPPVLTPWTDAAAGTVDDPAPACDAARQLLHRQRFLRAALAAGDAPLIVFSLLFGFSVSACGRAGYRNGAGAGRRDEVPFEDGLARELLRPHRLLRFLRRDGRKLRRTDHGVLCPRDAGLLPALLRLCAARLPASGVSRAAGARACGGCGGISCAPR